MDLKYENNRFFTENENGETLAEVTFPQIAEDAVCIKHTFVDESLRGQGEAARLIDAVVGWLRSEGRKAEVTCPYAIKWFEQHPEARDVLLERSETECPKKSDQ
jgi:hypothetical protein